MFRTRAQKITFEEAEMYIRTNKLEHLGRSLAQEEHYSRQNARLKDEWASICDFILHDKFSIDFVEEGGLKAVPRPLPVLPSDQNIRLARNDHPYFFEDGVEHWVLWKMGSQAVSEDEIMTAVKQLQECGGVQRWTCFQNPPALMSIPEIQHAHIIVRRESI
mmetsp:Transcript_25439/g.42883  ORF Transcript_25439/g.42883 Transcript_25439/m.42883 type:complete len:162 (+) Transcript_25439:47-532(+)